MTQKKKTSEEIKAEKFPTLAKHLSPWIERAQQTPNKHTEVQAATQHEQTTKNYRLKTVKNDALLSGTQQFK